MKKILPFVVVGILVLSGLGAVAIQNNPEELEIGKETGERATHAVLGEYGTATWCGYCHYAHTALKNIYASGDFDFYYVTYVRDKNPSVVDLRLFNELNLYGYPTCYFDGGYKVNVGGSTGTESAYRSSITQCANRNVYDVDIDLSASWLGGTNMQIDCTVTNNEASTYYGTVRVYITEVASSMNWRDTSGQLYTFPLLDYAFDADGTGEDVSISAGDSWSGSTTWDGASHGFPSVTEENTMVIAAIYNDDWHQGYSYPPSTNPFDAYYVDDCTGVNLGGGTAPDAPILSGPTNGAQNVEYDFSVVAVDPDGDNIYYNVDWGDSTSTGWIGPYPSGQVLTIANSWANSGEYDIIAQAKDTTNQVSDPSNPLTISIIENDPPSAPIIEGPTNGKVGVDYDYTFTSTDPDGDDIYYWVLWGDGCPAQEWVGPFASGEPALFTHAFIQRGTFTISVQARDIYEAESDWGYLEVTMPRNRVFMYSAISRILENFPNAFPLLKLILGL